MNWSDYPNFSKKEFDCKHTGENKMRPEFLEKLQELRTVYGKPMIITSGYRSPLHPVEARKSKAGAHTYGVAVDVLAHGVDAMLLFNLAYAVGFRRIGLKQKGGRPGRFIHLDTGDKDLGFPQALWTY